MVVDIWYCKGYFGIGVRILMFPLPLDVKKKRNILAPAAFSIRYTAIALAGVTCFLVL